MVGAILQSTNFQCTCLAQDMNYLEKHLQDIVKLIEPLQNRFPFHF